MGNGVILGVEVSCPSAVDRLVGVPGVDAGVVDACSGEEVLEAGFGEAGVAGAADAGAMGGLRHGARNAGPP
jgi:hypothetical protein